jgi:histone H3/H4
MSATHNNIWNENIKSVHLQIHSDLTISDEAATEISKMLNFIAGVVVSAAKNNIMKKGHNHITEVDIKIAVTNVMLEELAKHASSELMGAIKKFSTRKNMPIDKRAGLMFNISNSEMLIDDTGLNKGFIETEGSDISWAGIALTTVLEYIASEILELSGNSAMGSKRSEVVRDDVYIAIDNDPELGDLLNDYKRHPTPL